MNITNRYNDRFVGGGVGSGGQETASFAFKIKFSAYTNLSLFF